MKLGSGWEPDVVQLVLRSAQRCQSQRSQASFDSALAYQLMCPCWYVWLQGFWSWQMSKRDIEHHLWALVLHQPQIKHPFFSQVWLKQGVIGCDFPFAQDSACILRVAWEKLWTWKLPTKLPCFSASVTSRCAIYLFLLDRSLFRIL